MFIKSIPFMIVYMIAIGIINAIGPIPGTMVNVFLALFILPVLFINFFKKESAKALFEFKKLEAVYKYLDDYVITLLKSLALGLIFLIMFIILVGIPAHAFTKNIFLADFYRRRVK